MSNTRIFVPRDTTACALGAEAVASRISGLLTASGLDCELIRNGSRGAFWLEPLVEVESNGVRNFYGPLSPADVDDLFASGFPGECEHHLSLGCIDDIEWLHNQHRLTFERAGVVDPLSLDDYKKSGGYEGLANALKMTPDDIVEAVLESGLRGRGGAAFPLA